MDHNSKNKRNFEKSFKQSKISGQLPLSLEVSHYVKIGVILQAEKVLIRI